MFKRRKPDEGATPREPGAPATAPHAFAPQPFAPEPFAPQPFAPEPFAPETFASSSPDAYAPRGKAGTDGASFAAAGVSEAMLDGGVRPAEDSGLGVPPRPLPPLPQKEAPMARPSLPTPNAPSPGLSQGGMSQGGMSQSMGQGGMGQTMGPGGMSQGRGGPSLGSGPAGGPGEGMGRPRPQAPERRTLVVGRGISVQGTVQDAERLVVEGTVEASLIKASELAIAPGGLFKGEVEVQDAEVAGTIDGTLTASGNLVVRATGKVLGVARCRRLQVEDGGAITGRIEMLSEDGRPALQDTAA